MRKFGIFLTILLSVGGAEVGAAEQAKIQSVKYDLVGCSDEGGVVQAQLSGTKFTTWRADLAGSIRTSIIKVVYLAGSYHVVVAHSYKDGSRISYSTPVEMNGSNFTPTGMLRADFDVVLKDDLPGIEEIYRRSVEMAASGTVKGSIECH